MAAPMEECLCHLLEIDKEPIISCTQVSWARLLESAQVWASIDGLEKTIALKLLDKKEQEVPVSAGYHRRCYQRFTDAKRIRQGVTRKEKGLLRPSITLDENHEVSEPLPKHPKLLRSNFPSSGSRRRSEHVLPKECIICQKIKKKVDPTTGKRNIEHLSACETDGEKLLRAARIKNDDRILLQIGDLDPVCIEVHYHASCYKAYIKCIYEGKQTTKPLTKAFDSFCTEIIEKRLISNGEVMKITNLKNLFIDTAKNVEGLDITGYRNCVLKDRLQNRYSNLEFVQVDPKICELVYHSEDGGNTLITVPEDDSEGDTDVENELAANPSFCQPSTQDEFADIYRVAIMLRTAVTESPSVSIWPPTAADLTQSKCLEIVPGKLFNFLAWSCGLSDTFSTDKVELHSDEAMNKLLAISQDVLWLTSRGRKLMPKHLALGMTIRHLSGSAKLQNLLNAFGHCVSHSVTLEHDTALATQQINRESPVPNGFMADAFTTLVWDNNDFGEETITGKGTTHNTNGIIIQAVNSDVPRNPEETRTVGRDRKRTIDAPPADIVPFYGPRRKGPDQFQEKDMDVNRTTDIQEQPKLIDQALHHAKFHQDEVVLPGWTTCNQILSKDSKPLNNIGYLPVIDASPTEKSTVNTILEKSLDIANDLNLPGIVLVMDQAIYAKAQEIRWQGTPEFRDKLVIRLGEFHTAMAFLGVIGKRFSDAGLRDIAIESNLVAEGSINGVISGHHYNRSVRCHKILSEAMHRLRIQEYLDQLPPDKSQEAIAVMQQLQADFPSRFMDCLQTDATKQFMREYKDHVNTRCQDNSMYSFWTSYLDMVGLLLLFLRGTREGNWELHLSTIRDMIPWFFSYGRINYSRYLPIYYLEMRDLKSTHPFLHTHLSAGEFTVKRHDGNGFAQTACDQVIEQTFNRDSKTRGGLTGLTLNKGAVRRWILSHPDRAAIATSCYNMSSIKHDKETQRPERVASQAIREEDSVQDVMMTIKGFSNPFTHEDQQELVNICSGKIASDDVKSDLFCAFKRGDDCFQRFVMERLSTQEKDVFDTLKLPSGKTFSDIDKKTTTKNNQVTATLKEHRNLLVRLLMIAQEKNLNLQEVLKYPLSSMPYSLATFDGLMVKTSKATLLHAVEKSSQDHSSYKDLTSNNKAVIVDAMVLIQQQTHFPATFGEFATSILKQLLSICRKHNAKRVDFVADRYLDMSIKDAERRKRSTQGETKFRIIRSDQRMPKLMKKFLASGSNKEGLLTFIVDEWKYTSPQSPSDITVYATRGDVCVKFSSGTDGNLLVEDVPDLSSDHEEADSRMFLHVYHASKSIASPLDIIVCTVDTDVFVIALWVSTLITARLILFLMTGSRSRQLDMQAMSKAMKVHTAEALVGLHPFTGCDSVSAFKGKGKVKALKLMLNSPQYISTFCELGKDWELGASLVADVEKFVCELYGWKDTVKVNTARYNCYRIGSVTDLTLPPNSDSLSLHLKRANYQAKIYRSCLQQRINAPDPSAHGWKVNGSKLDILWNTLPIAPQSVLQDMKCNCKKTDCNSNKCSCRKAGVQCTAMCRCEQCTNQTVVEDDHVDTDSSDNDSDSEN